jgi:hypothetical protein
MSSKKNRSICEPEMTFQDCELAILRHAVDKGEKMRSRKVATSEEMGKIIHILETFLKQKKLICYGGTAINNILPQEAQFYDRSVEIPDYDFFSTNAMDDAKDLADIYFKEGYYEVEAKAGVHFGTYKVFVNFIGIADITQLHSTIYKSIEKEAIIIEGIHYCPPNYLRMSMFLELSRPDGDLSRWEKVLKRMNILNEYYPLKATNCHAIDFQRKLDTPALKEDSEKYYYIMRDTFIEQGAVFFGGYAVSLYSKYMPKSKKHQMEKIPDFDVLAEDPEKLCDMVKNKLAQGGFKQVTVKKHDEIGEIIPEHYEIKVQKETMALVFKPIACHAYNKLFIDGKHINIASIDTMLSFYLAFIYADKPYFLTDRILCMAMYLFEVEQKNRLSQRGLLKRFTLSCFGKQSTLEDIRNQKTIMYEKYNKKKKDRTYEMWFLRYVPKPKSKEGNGGEEGKKNRRSKEGTKKTKKEMMRKKGKTQKVQHGNKEDNGDHDDDHDEHHGEEDVGHDYSVDVENDDEGDNVDEVGEEKEEKKEEKKEDKKGKKKKNVKKKKNKSKKKGYKTAELIGISPLNNIINMAIPKNM